MKKRFYVAGLALSLLMAGCTQELEERVGVLEGKLASLETRVAELNSQMGLIQQLLSGKYFVQSVSDLSDGSGYQLVLVDADGNQVVKTVKNGENGQDGEDGHDGTAPEMGLRQDKDGNYYWTLNGQWLLVDGKKVCANGSDGLTPEIKVENGKWYYRVGDGAWTYAGEAVTTVQGPIQTVTVADGVVVFVLSDGTTLEVPLAAAAPVKLQIVLDETAFQSMTAGQTKSTAYEVKVPSGVSYTLDSYEPEGWTVTYSEPKNNKGTLTIKLPSGAKPGKVMLVANGSDGSSYVKVLPVGKAGSTTGGGDTPTTTEVTVDATSGSYSLPTDATNVVIPQSASSWVSVQGGQIVLAENTTYDSRTVTVTYKVGDQTYTVTITQAQKDAIVLTSNSLAAAAAGGNLTCVVKANVKVKATSGANWITVNPSTKGLVDKTFTLTVAANTATSARSGQVTFSNGSLSQTVTVNQEAGSGDNPPQPPTPGGDEFVLVTDAGDLADGDEILIVSEEESKAIGTNQKANNRAAVDVTISDHTIAADDLSASVQVITLMGSSSAWNLAVDEGYLASAASGNKLVTSATVTDNAKWTISVESNGEASIVAQAGASQYLRYNPNANNSGGALFSCYTSSSSIQNPVYIYRKGAGSSEPSYVTQYSQLGVYLGSSNQRIYSAGADQYVRLQENNQRSFILLNPASKEQVVISGISTSASVGQEVQVSVDWKQGKQQKLSKQYTMSVLQDSDGKLWIGDAKGKGFIIKK